MSTLRKAMGEAFAANPDLKKVSDFLDQEIARHVRDGTMTLDEAIVRLREISADPTVNALLLRENLEASVVYQESPDQTPKLNPLWGAEIVERLQFDGDVPELRTKHMPEGFTPAVPVLTDTTDPVVLGLLLEKASEEVTAEFKERALRLAPEVERKLLASEQSTSNSLVPQSESKVLLVYEHPEVDPPGYKRGQVPALRKVELPVVGHLSRTRRQDLVWKALSSTQGRRSAVHPIQTRLLEFFHQRGLKVEGATTVSGEPLVQHSWTMTLTGPRDIQTKFSPLRTALTVLQAKLLRDWPEEGGVKRLCVRPVNAISERIVGWTAGLYAEEHGSR